MKRFAVGLLLAAVSTPAWASCDSMPYVLTNGTVANADQVMADFDCLAQGTFGGGVQTKSGSIGINRNTSNGVIYDTSRGAYQFQQYGNSTNDDLDVLQLQVYRPNGAFASMPFVADRAGRVAINNMWTNSNWTLYVNGTAAGNSGWAIASDERLKTNIIDVDHGLDTILQLRPVRFSWKAGKDRAVGSKMNLDMPSAQVGFLAQDVAKVIPEAVVKPQKADETYSMVPTDIIPFLVQAIKEQQGQIKALQQEVDLLKAQK